MAWNDQNLDFCPFSRYCYRLVVLTYCLLVRLVTYTALVNQLYLCLPNLHL